MTGIQCATDEEGRRVAVQLDLCELAELWEEIDDSLVSESRRDKERILLDRVKAKLIQGGRLRG